MGLCFFTKAAKVPTELGYLSIRVFTPGVLAPVWNLLGLRRLSYCLLKGHMGVTVAAPMARPFWSVEVPLEAQEVDVDRPRGL